MVETADAFFARGCGRCDRFDSPDCSARVWADGLARLREICRASGANEAARWGAPTYRAAGRNVAIIGATRNGFLLSFFDPALLSAADGVLEPAGPNAQTADTMRFASRSDVDARAETIADLLAQAVDAAVAGRRSPTRRTEEPALPAELVDALDADPDLAAAFAALTPGRRRSHALAVGSAKKPETRRARVQKLRDRIFAGKGAQER